MKSAKRPPPIPASSPLQPEKCRGCTRGEWAGSKQVCFVKKCIKE